MIEFSSSQAKQRPYAFSLTLILISFLSNVAFFIYIYILADFCTGIRMMGAMVTLNTTAVENMSLAKF